MRETLYKSCENFIENRDAIKSAFAWESEYLYPVCAAMFTEKSKTVNIEYMKQCRDILKARTGLFSNFRATGKLAMLSMLAVEGNPEGRMDQALQMYDALKGHFFTSEYLPLASMILADMVHPVQYGEIAARTRRIYNLMKENHPFLTSGEDSVFAALLALSERTDEQAVAEMEQCYQLLRQEFGIGNALQSLSHVLALGNGTPEEKCTRTIELYRRLKDSGYKYGREYELATLGVLALLPGELEDIAKDVMDVDNYLAGEKGYGFFGLGKKQRLMHAGMLVAGDRIDAEESPVMGTAAISGTISLIAAQQAAMYAAIASAAAASNAANY